MVTPKQQVDISTLDQLSLRCKLHGQYITGIKTHPSKGYHLKCWLCVGDENLKFSDLINLKDFQNKVNGLQEGLKGANSIVLDAKVSSIDFQDNINQIQHKIDDDKQHLRQSFDNLIINFKQECDKQYEQLSRQLDNELNTLKSNINNYNNHIKDCVSQDDSPFQDFLVNLMTTTDINKYDQLIAQFLGYQDFVKLCDEKSGANFSQILHQLGEKITQQMNSMSSESKIVESCNIQIQQAQNQITSLLSKLSSINQHGIQLLTLSYFQNANFRNSRILNPSEQQILNNICQKQFGKKIEAKLFFRGSIDGFKPSEFHKKCDSLSQSLILIKTTDGDKFGGYTEKPWMKNFEGYHSSNGSWLFNLERNEVYNVKLPNEALYSSSMHGPVFGQNDLFIGDDCNKRHVNLSRLGNSYNSNGQNHLGKKEFFQIEEMDVYTVSQGD